MTKNIMQLTTRTREAIIDKFPELIRGKKIVINDSGYLYLAKIENIALLNLGFRHAVENAKISLIKIDTSNIQVEFRRAT